MSKLKESTRMFKSFRASRLSVLIFLLLIAGLTTGILNAQRRQSSAAAEAPKDEANPLKALLWRSIGPFRGGRVTAVACVACQPLVFYFRGSGRRVSHTCPGG